MANQGMGGLAQATQGVGPRRGPGGESLGLKNRGHERNVSARTESELVASSGRLYGTCKTVRVFESSKVRNTPGQ